MRISRYVNILGLLWTIGALLACNSSPHATHNDPILIENEGFVCFHINRYEPDQLRISLQTDQHHCFSSGCTDVFERTGALTIDQATFAIQITSRFVAAHQKAAGQEPKICALDCGGAGMLLFNRPLPDPGSYTVILGEEAIGTIMIEGDLLPYGPQCLSSPLPTPAAVYPSPEPLVTSTPSPPLLAPPTLTPGPYPPRPATVPAVYPSPDAPPRSYP
jgi:hypothetical protein